MAHQQQRAGKLAHQFLEQLQRVDVEVVGRLVHHQQVGGTREQSRQQQAVAFAAGQRRGRRAQLLRAEQEIPEVAGHVARLAVDDDVIAAVGDVFHHRALELQLRALLVVVGDLEPRAAPEHARCRLDLPQQQPDQRALAGAVRADDADAVAAHDRQIDVAQHRATAELHAGALGLEHLAAGLGRLLQRDVDAADALASQAVFLAQPVQRAHAALVARAPRLHALADPHLFLRQLLVEQRGVLRFGRELLRLLPRVGVVVAVPAGERAAIQLDDARRDAVDEGAVVADAQQRAGEAEQQLLQPLDRLDVEMVGGLVEQQHVRLDDQRAREQRPPPPAAGQRGVVRSAVEAEARQHLVHALHALPVLHVRRGGIERRGDDVAHAAAADVGDVLREQRDARARPQPDAALVRRRRAGDQPQQRGLALAVAADDADALAGLHRKAGGIQQRPGAEGERDLVEAEQHRARRSVARVALDPVLRLGVDVARLAPGRV